HHFDITGLILHLPLPSQCQLLTSPKTKNMKSFFLAVSFSPSKETILRSREGRTASHLDWSDGFDLPTMGVSYRFASSVLLCPEDGNSILGCDEEEKQEQGLNGEVERRSLCHFPGERGDFYGEPLQSEDRIALMVERESHHLPEVDYAGRLRRGQLDLAARSDAIDWIQRVGLSCSLLSCFPLISGFLSTIFCHKHWECRTI
ncbi:hypothetical protein BHE74_00056035, partial [Ensete ventricosum]